LARIQRRYETAETHVNLGGQRFPFVRVADPNVVLDRVAEEDSQRQGKREPGAPLHLPYWAELWDSAIGMGAYVLSGAGPALAGKAVLDLGCGMGLAGCVAASAGANVVFADLETDPLLFARLNSLAWEDQVRTQRLDWRTHRLSQRFDVILGADILYERSQWDYLEPFWRDHLALGGQVLLGEPGRQTGEAFVPWISSRGWRLQTVIQPVSTRPVPIRLLTLTLQGGA
jgi:predicted nicotinamide N-methyase